MKNENIKEIIHNYISQQEQKEIYPTAKPALNLMGNTSKI